MLDVLRYITAYITHSRCGIGREIEMTKQAPTVASIVEELNRLFPATKGFDPYKNTRQTHEQTEEDRLEADHIRVESHSSRFI